MYEIRLTTQSKRSYSHLDPIIRQRINKVFTFLEEGNFQHKNITPLRGQLAGFLRYRVGDWRIVFRVDNEKRIVIIESITTRGGAYR